MNKEDSYNNKNINDIESILFNLIDKHKNIYELSELYEQNRKNIHEYIDHIKCTNCGSEEFEENERGIRCKKCNMIYPIKNNVLDCRLNIKKSNEEWIIKNKNFLNYHKSLSAYVLLNQNPIWNYVGFKTQLNKIKNKIIIDVGGGTGQTFSSFFFYTETLDYYLVDPNLRLLHDQFIRIYPKLLEYPISHILSYAESLPFKNNFSDIVMSLSSIDHFNNYKKFIIEAFRVLKPGGNLFISSHLDIDKKKKRLNKKNIYTIFEWLARNLYKKKYKVSKDDHTFHFKSSEPIENSMKETGFKIVQKEKFKGFFYLLGEKV
ncbi:MAG: class I SAM-dependent methyltransferase [FCB group bacterium]|nr:class I SAM-dependent methyltransferase [FCB group bacterium]